MGLTPPTNFPVRLKKNTQSRKQATKSKVYFHYLFLRVLHWRCEMRLWQPGLKIFARTPTFPFKVRKLSYKVFFCFRKTKLPKLFPWTRGLHFFENHALLFYWKSKFFFCPKSEVDRKTVFNVSFSQFLFSTHVNWCFDTPG